MAVLRGDDRRAERPAAGHPRAQRHAQRADVDHEHRRVHVERGRRRAAAAHLPPRAGRAACARRSRRSRAWSATRAASSSTGTTTAPARSSSTGRRARRPVRQLAVVGRQRLARDRPEGRRRQRARAVAPGPRAVRQHGLRLLLPAGRNQILFHYVVESGEQACCYDTYVSESRIASYIGVAKGEIPPQVVFGTWRSFGDSCDWSWTETKPAGFNRTYFGIPVFDGALAVQRHARHPELGRQHVRGADAGAVRAGGALGAGQLGRQPPADRRCADPPRARRGRLRLLGLLARERAGGRLHGLRRRRRRQRSRRQPVRQQLRAGRPRLARLPRPPGLAGSAAGGVHERRRHPARRVPRAALPPARGDREPAPASSATSTSTRGSGSSTR